MRMKGALELVRKYHPTASISVETVMWYFADDGNYESKIYKISVQTKTHIHLFEGTSWVNCIEGLKSYKFNGSDLMNF